MAKGAKSTTRAKNSRAKTNASKATQAQKLQNATDAANEAVKVGVVMEQPAGNSDNAASQGRKEVRIPLTTDTIMEILDLDTLKQDLTDLTPEQLQLVLEAVSQGDKIADAILKAEQAQKARQKADEPDKADPDPSGDTSDAGEQESLSKDTLSAILDYLLTILRKSQGTDQDQDQNQDKAQDANQVHLTDTQLRQLTRMIDDADEAGIPAVSRFNAASGEANTPLKDVARLLNTVNVKLSRAMRKKKPEDKINILEDVVSQMPALLEAFSAFQAMYKVEHDVSLEIARKADKLRQEVTTVTRWAFGGSKSEGRRRTHAPKDTDVRKAGTDDADDADDADDTNTPVDDTDDTNAPADGTDGAKAPADGTDGAKAPADGTDGANTPADGTDGAKAPADGTDGANAPADSTDGAKAPADGTNGARAPADGTNTPADGTDGTNGKNKKSTQKKAGKANTPEGLSLSAEDFEIVRLTLAAAIRTKRMKVFDQVDHPLTEEQLICKRCGAKMHRNGWVHSGFELVVRPAEFVVVEHRVESAVCEHCRETRADGKRTTVKASYANEKLSNRSYLSVSLASFLAVYWPYFGVSKYRLQILTAMMGFPINSSVMGRLLEDIRPWILPLYEMLVEETLNVPILYVDETTWRTQRHLILKDRRDCRVFSFTTDPNGGKPIRVYMFKTDRKAEHIRNYLGEHKLVKDCLEGQQLVIVTDGYQGYENLDNIIHCLCWAHLRRMFLDAIPQGKKDSNCTARTGFDLCSDIILMDSYLEDRFGHDGQLTPDERADARKKYTRHLVDKFFLWCENVQFDKRANEKLLKAINYALNHRTELSNFIVQGLAAPTSNIVESALRPIANLRKIFMHTGNDESSQLLMMLETINQTAAINNLNPQKYMETYLTRMLKLGKTPPKEELAKLLPWAEEMQKSVMHLDLPKQKRKPWTEERIEEHRDSLHKTMLMAYASSKTLQKVVTQDDWLHIPWGKGPDPASSEAGSTETPQGKAPEASVELPVTA